MIDDDYKAFLKRWKKPSSSTMKRYLDDVRYFTDYLNEYKNGIHPKDASPQDLEDFFTHFKQIKPKRVLTCTWGLQIYYEYLQRHEMRVTAISYQWDITSKPLELIRIIEMRNWDVWYISQFGYDNVRDLLNGANTPEKRKEIAKKTAISEDVILELVKMAEISRIPGIKRKRVKLYYDGGYDTLEKIAQATPEEIKENLTKFIEKTSFDGWAPEIKEAEEAITIAKYLKSKITY